MSNDKKTPPPPPPHRQPPPRPPEPGHRDYSNGGDTLPGTFDTIEPPKRPRPK